MVIRKIKKSRIGTIQLGFTLIELLVVLAIVALLLSISLPKYFHSIDVAKDAVLAENLKITRDVINKFYSDTGRYPETLDELVEKKYLKTLPIDPVTEKNFIMISPNDGYKGSVYDVKTSATGISRTGKPYSNF